MNTAGFRGRLTPNGQIAVPPEIAARVPPGEQAQVVLQWGVSVDDAEWRAAVRRQFDAAYADDDSVYEVLIHDPSTRQVLELLENPPAPNARLLAAARALPQRS